MHERFNASTWLVDRHVDEGRGDAIAIRCQGRTLTYAEVRDEVERVAGGLRSLGVRPEERVAVVMLDSPQMVATFLGAMRIGAIPVLTNPLLPGRDLGVIIADSRARIVVASHERASSLPDLLAGAPEVTTVVTTGGDAGTHAWADLTAAGGDAEPYTTWYDSPGFWLCTSGTTGMPKLAMHTHGHIKDTCDTYATGVLNIGRDDRCFSVGPMFHAYGLGNSLTFPFSVGATSILEPTRPPTPALVSEIVTTEEPTLFFCIPTFYAALTNADLPEETFASVRYGVSAAEALPAETFTRFRERYGVTILDGIGSTELLHIFLSNTPDRCHPGSSGVAVPGYDVRVVDEHGDDARDDEPGQLIVRGASAATGYWCRSEQSRATFAGDWTRTGDLYVRSADGYHTYLGRADDMLRVGGEWVSPAEVEGVLIEHASVLEAAVVGERDEAGILRPVAHVISAPGHAADPGALTDWCRERLAGYKRPARYTMVDELPKTATGKIQRYKLRSD
ncbi:MAG: benzoate-CoA ligase family protein [Actinomycetota bacterium]